MKEMLNNKIVKFLLGHVLTNLFWILPFQFFFLSKSWFQSFAFFCFVVSYTYWEYKKYLAPPKLKLYHTSVWIEVGYNISIWGFLLATCYSVFWGLMNNYVTNSKTELWFVLVYSIALCALLITITYMIKSGRKWFLLCIVYLAFDLPGAMPFNFLFFYENKKIQSRLDEDKKLVPKLISDSKVLFLPMIKTSDSVYHNLISIRNTRSEEAYRKLVKQNKSIAENNRIEIIQKKLKEDNFEHPKNETVLLGRYENLNNLNKKTDSILNNLDTICKNNFVSNKVGREKQILIMADVKTNLAKVIVAINDSALKTHLKELLPDEPTQTESIKALYGYIYDIFSNATVSKEIVLEEDTMSQSQPVTLKFKKNKEEKEKHLIISSLIPSIIIDLMPLLFSIVYARWNNKKEGIV